MLCGVQTGSTKVFCVCAQVVGSCGHDGVDVRRSHSLHTIQQSSNHLGRSKAEHPRETSRKSTTLHSRFAILNSSSLLRCFRTQPYSHLPMGVATRLVASTPTQADAIRWGGVTSIDTGAAAISSDRHSNRIRHERRRPGCWGVSNGVLSSGGPKGI